jgi:outer membrane protease
MKNIPALTILVIIVGAFLTNNSAYCQNYGFAFGQQYGIFHGQAFEYVYPLPDRTKGELWSELKWDMKPLVYYGFQLDFQRTKLTSAPGFFSSASFMTGLPADTGKMEDRDWDSVVNDELTHFSSHTNRTKELYWLDASLGLSFPVKPYLYVKLFLHGSWMRFSFTGRNGYGKYARDTAEPYSSGIYYPIDDNPNTKQYTGEVIRYEQNWLLLSEGISIGTDVLSPFLIDLSVLFSPFTYCAAVDNHLDPSKTVTYRDFSSRGVFFEPKAKVSFYIKPVEFAFEYSYRYIGKTRGEAYSKPANRDFFSLDGEAGASLSLSKFNFLLKLYI